jgi:hypothetical protein
LTAGAYLHALRNLRIGAFSRLQYGRRHDEDWIQSDLWHWADTTGRAESVLILDASPRAELDFLPGTSWTGELKTRFHHDFFNRHRTLTLRPGLTYFWLREGRPLASFFLHYELHLPLNHGRQAIQERWAYLGGLYHLSPSLQLGATASFRSQTWASTDAFTARTGGSFSITGDSLGLSALVVFQPGQ